MLQEIHDAQRLQLVDYGELKQKFADADAEVNQLIVMKSELQEHVDQLEALTRSQANVYRARNWVLSLFYHFFKSILKWFEQLEKNITSH